VLPRLQLFTPASEVLLLNFFPWRFLTMTWESCHPQGNCLTHTPSADGLHTPQTWGQKRGWETGRKEASVGSRLSL
jgi:hypothetical protein